MRSRTLLIGTCSLVLTVVTALPALAVPGTWVDIDDDASEVEVGASDGDATSGTGGGGSASGCTWTAIADLSELTGPVGGEAGGGALPDLEDAIDNPADYDWYWRSCPDGQDGTITDLIPVPADTPPVDPTALRDTAVERLGLPTPAVGMNPPGDQVVHVESWLWIDGSIWRTHSESATAGGVTATVTATPRRVIWDVGNGETVVCDGPGTPYDTSRSAAEQSTDCSYTYRHSSAGQPGEAYQVVATVEWEVSWSVAGAGGGGPLPAMFTSYPVSVRVAELQALNQ